MTHSIVTQSTLSSLSIPTADEIDQDLIMKSDKDLEEIAIFML